VDILSLRHDPVRGLRQDYPGLTRDGLSESERGLGFLAAMRQHAAGFIERGLTQEEKEGQLALLFLTARRHWYWSAGLNAKRETRLPLIIPSD